MINPGHVPTKKMKPIQRNGHTEMETGTCFHFSRMTFSIQRITQNKTQQRTRLWIMCLKIFMKKVMHMLEKKTKKKILKNRKSRKKIGLKRKIGLIRLLKNTILLPIFVGKQLHYGKIIWMLSKIWLQTLEVPPSRDISSLLQRSLLWQCLDLSLLGFSFLSPKSGKMIM